jgi:D-alanyl-D-alanine dipeptidase
MFLGKYSGGNVTKKHQENRLMLQNVMTKHGFKPYTNEWWHFTLKDEPFPQTWFGFPIK